MPATDKEFSSPFCEGFGEWKGNCTSRRMNRVKKYCRNCAREAASVGKQCQNYPQCPRNRWFDTTTKEYLPVCRSCYLFSSAPTCLSQKCEALVSYDFKNKTYFEMCRRCFSSVEKRCPNFDKCGGYRAWNKEGETRMELCKSCDS
jgi:hypothetical protein